MGEAQDTLPEEMDPGCPHISILPRKCSQMGSERALRVNDHVTRYASLTGLGEFYVLVQEIVRKSLCHPHGVELQAG